MNSINLIGNICNDLELKSTNNGKYVCSFNLAVKRPFSKETTDFLPIVCWEKQAETVSKFCHKGDRIAITGTLTSRKYQDKDGNNRTAFDIIAHSVMFLEKKKEDKPNVDVDPENDALAQFKDSLEAFQEVDPDDDCPF